ncbi:MULTISPECIES: PrpF domain-containing protein [Actinopolyspora]|uniref:2-methylaconitate cis-trans isomerase n=1 Tax=Actinopolyspora saharensis TaxID=995062 RepID=A0A1H0Z308_9ACTN|nr:MULTISPECIES: PrpF domain-containing protein [Actinopolyspora]NHD16063.1 hypothetical protein [Actinopolyspora sp. BKK2]NHE74723.1 hypothetical protein [Actinopolyspora sp. BKK1]SDQ21783.1 2-methylaconitate cis-trans isomerase [Actinopolyspora saharensis]
MLTHIAAATGAPSSTLVLSADSLPGTEEELAGALRDATDWLCERGLDDITKIALIAPSRHPLFDLDYRFVQVLPGAVNRFDFRGSCGHSILASVVVASRLGWIPKLAPEHRIRVRVTNNNDRVVCEVDESVRDRTTFTVHFLRQQEARLDSLLRDGQPVTGLSTSDGGIRVSQVSAGNPYVFVSAADLGVSDVDELFGDNGRLYDSLSEIRRSAAVHAGLPPEGAFPKIAALLPDGDATLAVRALSVPSWHPTIALTGAVCLGAATKIEGTVPNVLAGSAARPGLPLTIRTPGGATVASAAVSGAGLSSTLSWVSVPHKEVVFRGAVDIDSLRPHTRKDELLCL